MKEINENIDWLDEHFLGLKKLEEVKHNMAFLMNKLEYTFPHIAKDIAEDIETLDEGIKLISSSLQRSMKEQTQKQNEFVGTMLTGLLKAEH